MRDLQLKHCHQASSMYGSHYMARFNVSIILLAVNGDSCCVQHHNDKWQAANYLITSSTAVVAAA